MDVEKFLRTRPCLEELDGYLEGLRIQIENPGLFHAIQYEVIDGDVLKPIEAYRQRLLKGKEMPNESRLERQWTYQKGKPPTRKRKHEHQTQDEPQPQAHRKSLDLNSRRRQR